MGECNLLLCFFFFVVVVVVFDCARMTLPSLSSFAPEVLKLVRFLPSLSLLPREIGFGVGFGGDCCVQRPATDELALFPCGLVILECEGRRGITEICSCIETRICIKNNDLGRGI